MKNSSSVSTQINAASPLRGRHEEFLRVPTQEMDEREFTRLLLECLFDDMDRSLRELSVGDTGVSRRVRTMSKAAYGRLKAYKECWESDQALRDALLRNVYRGKQVAAEAVDELLRYMREYNLQEKVSHG